MPINCKSLRFSLKSDSQFFGEDQKIVNHFLNLNLALFIGQFNSLLIKVNKSAQLVPNNVLGQFDI